ncbi:MAG: class I SAM-dependent methyltransferase [Candidatus Omnitrophica bacterium]|nr:class I SAM-dependent methyltransferase [Candidatus Omnitrophota bacterium]
MRRSACRIRACLKELKGALSDPFERDKLYGQQFFRYRSILRSLPDAGEDTQLLEIGAGPGHISRCVRRLGFKVRCIDVAPHPDDRRWPQWGIPVEECDIERQELPFADNTFSVVLFNDVLEHLMDDPVRTIRRLARVLTPGGLLVLTTPNVHYLPLVFYPFFGKNVFPILEEYYQRPRKTKLRELYDRHNRLFTMDEVLEVIRAGGLVVRSRRFEACAEPVYRYRDRLAYTHEFSFRRLYDTDCLKKLLYRLVTALIPRWRSWILVTAVKE